MNTFLHVGFLKGTGKRFFLYAFICTTGTWICSGQLVAAQSGDSLAATHEIVSPISNIDPLIIGGAVPDTLPLDQVACLPYSYPGQMLNGNIAGVDLLRPSGEPGVSPLVLLRGLSVPIGNYEDVYSNQPLYIVNGIPLIRNDHPYQLSIKEYPYTGIGSGIDISSLIDMNNVEKLEVVKGAAAVAMYGVHAANGAIVITTRTPQKGKYHIGLNLYGGVALIPPLNTTYGNYAINGAYERDFLLPFYKKYASATESANFPAYLADSTHAAYFGPANWTDLYYRNALQHGMGLNISGGSDRANFRFGVGEHTEDGVADQTALKRYNVYYDMYIVPLKSLSIRTYVQAATANRDRNHSLRERFAEMAYFPNQEYPLPPNKTYLQQYYANLDEGIDKNQVNSIQGLVHVKYDILKGLSLNSRFSVDYNDNHRNYFVPGALNDGNSFNSYFSGVNRRIIWNNFASFNKSFSNKNYLELQLGQSLEYDRMQYGYIRGYRGPSDFIKVIQVNSSNNTWVTHDKTLVYSYKDYLNQHLVSFYGHATYSLKDRYTATLSLRSDGSSYFGNGYYWAVSPMLLLSWDLKTEPWLKTSHFINTFKLSVDGGRMARLPAEDYYGYGPYYTVDIGWEGSEKVSSYASFPTLSMPFSAGYVGGGIKWPYTDQWGASLNIGILQALQLDVSVYSKTGRDLMLSVPADASYGFSSQWVNGMDVRNTGTEINLRGDFKIASKLTWQSGIVFQYNTSKLLALPNGLRAIMYGSRRLEVGKPVDQFWLLQNEGIYEKESDIPVASNGAKLTYGGIPFQVGDPKWKDINHDGVIDNDDRVLQGHVMAPIHGGWNNELKYNHWTLSFSFIYSLGSDILNGAVADRFNFANREGVDGPAGVKELTFWSVKSDLTKYPRYNPWSFVDPYQTDQTLFYEKADYLKLQSISLKYDLTELSFLRKSNINRLQIYVTGTNLFTATPYTGSDPSLVNYFGYDYGYAELLPTTFTVGINAEF